MFEKIKEALDDPKVMKTVGAVVGGLLGTLAVALVLKSFAPIEGEAPWTGVPPLESME